MVNKNSPISEQNYLNIYNSLSSDASKSLADLIHSFSQEQIVNQDLLLSLSFALRSFTNLQRFLELIPLLLTQLVGVKGSLLIPFQDNGTIWREQLQIFPIDEDQEIFRQLLLFEEGTKIGFGMQEKNILLLDYVSDLEKTWLFLNSSLLISTSSNEGFGIPLLDALSINLEAIATDIPSHREIKSLSSNNKIRLIKENDDKTWINNLNRVKIFNSNNKNSKSDRTDFFKRFIRDYEKKTFLKLQELIDQN